MPHEIRLPLVAASLTLPHIAMGRGGSEFGHAGNGGSLGFADPVRKLSFGLTKNRMRWPEPTEDTSYLVAETIRAYLDEITA